MTDHLLPLKNPKPDCEQFVRVLMGESTSERPPLVEYLVDDAIRRPITEKMLGREWVDPGADRESQIRALDNFVEFWYRMGYDFVRLELGLGFVSEILAGDDPTAVGGKRGWLDEHKGMIRSQADLEAYRWPRVDDFDFFPLEYIGRHLPEGMGLITNHSGGPFEVVTTLMSYEGFCLALYDDPQLVQAVTQKVGELMEAFYHRLAELPSLIALFQGDDMGFRSGPLAPPAVFRELFLPWHKRFAAIAHDRRLPYLLHSCGEISSIMDDLIDDVGIDGKHSFEDAILPAPEFQARYGKRIATLGGVDVNVLAGSTPERVYRQTQDLMSACAPAGRYAIGSGNSVPSYVPLENYMAMVTAALTWSG